jgi:hypothetical protein
MAERPSTCFKNTAENSRNRPQRWQYWSKRRSWNEYSLVGPFDLSTSGKVIIMTNSKNSFTFQTGPIRWSISPISFDQPAIPCNLFLVTDFPTRVLLAATKLP